MHRSFLLRRGSGIHSAVASVITHPSHRRRVVDDGLVVDVVDNGDVHISYSAVVQEPVTLPTPAFEAFSEITEAVNDAAIEADMRTPVPVIKHKSAVDPCPVRGRPEKANLRRKDPGPWHPEVIVIVVAPRPVAGSPDIAVTRAKWLLIDRQRRRPEGNRDAELT
jgi:hypothetical protein